MRRFIDINELIEHLKKHEYVYYQAPLDARPYSVKIRQYTVNNESFEKSKATLWTSVNGNFTVKLTEHFDRFRVREDI